MIRGERKGEVSAVHSLSSALFLMSLGLMGAQLVPAADATCQVRLRYFGDFPNHIWDPESPLTNVVCLGSCPTSGACQLSSKDVSPTQRDYWCECPSGGGDGGCRGTIVRLWNHETWTLKLVCTDGGCGDKETCDWLKTDPPSGFNSNENWAKCSCQVNSPP